MSDADAVVIGAGNAGLTAAATLQRAGLRTLLQ
ncbi:FAD-binding protein [Streptomyces abikoensis]|uniref:FAD-binding protein n=1 Tax=Streptomyces abikoensis TaxID=97398 RepID=A0ABW7TCY7_9ACTN